MQTNSDIPILLARVLLCNQCTISCSWQVWQEKLHDEFYYIFHEGLFASDLIGVSTLNDPHLELPFEHPGSPFS